MHKLVKFSLAKNQVSSLPNSICHLTSLISLNVSFNKL